jgi:hypothetical protein
VEPLPATDDQAQTLQQKTGKNVQVIDGVLYIAKNPNQPEVGDYRVTFTQVPLQTASIVAQQAGSTFQPYHTRAGGTVSLIKPGKIDATELFKEAQSDNRMWTWLIRLGGCVLMFVGFVMITRPIAILADVLPILGDIVAAGLGLVGLMATLVLAPVIIAIAWFVYRPVVAIIVLVVGALLFVGVGWLAKQRKTRKAATSVAA